MSERDAPPFAPELDPETLAKLRATMKAELRRSIGALRRSLPADARARRDLAITEALDASGALTRARTVAAYSAVRGEVDPRRIVERCWQQGLEVVLPRVDRAQGTLGWYAHRPDLPLIEGAYGILEPGPEAPSVDPVRIDLVLVPAVAFDERGHRLGMGMGFYDRALPLLPNARRIGLAFDFQLVAELPHEPHDQPVDLVISDRHVLDTERGRAR